MSVDAEAQADFATLGVKIALTDPEADKFKVWSINVDAINVFLGLATQWRMLATSHRAFWLGIDYVAAEVVMRQYRVADASRTFFDLQAMERAALSAFDEVTV